jgi:hypothetical protein
MFLRQFPETQQLGLITLSDNQDDVSHKGFELSITDETNIMPNENGALVFKELICR